MEHSRHFQILYGLVAILGVLVCGLFYIVARAGLLGMRPQVSPISMQSQGGITRPDAAAIHVGGGSSVASTTDFIGTIAQINSASVTLHSVQNTTYTIAIDPSTKFQLAGKLLDPATYQKEMNVYNAQVAQLMQDPIKNKAALAALMVPTTQPITPASISNFAVGDQVVVAATGASAGSYTAVSITKNSGQ